MPKLETQRDRVKELKVAAKIAAEWGYKYEQMGEYAPFDIYLMRENNIKALIEIRIRYNELVCYPTVYFALHKWFTLINAEIGLHMAGLFAVAFYDGIYFVRIGELPVNKYDVVYKGRTDRGAFNDLSPIIEVPTDQFKYITDSKGVFED